jgi:hypothetical protein
VSQRQLGWCRSFPCCANVTGLSAASCWRGLPLTAEPMGPWDDSRGYSEGSLARVIEAAVAASPLLPSVKADPDFLCGMEFDSLSAELAFFQRHGLDVEEVAQDVALRPGQVMVF